MHLQMQEVYFSQMQPLFSKHHCCKHKQKKLFFILSFVFFGLSSLLWLILRTGRKPSRINYPCQKMALGNSVIFFGWLFSLFGLHNLIKRSKKLSFKLLFFPLFLLLVFVGFRIYNISKNNLLPKAIWGQSTKSKVVWIKDERAAKGWSANLDFENKADQEVVTNMMSEAIRALTNQPTVNAAWTYLFTHHNSDNHDYQQGEKIAVKLNLNNNIHDINTNQVPMIQTIRALLNQLVNQKGVREEDIIIYDTTRDFVSYQRNGILNYFPNVVLSPTNTCLINEKILGARISQVIKEANYIINMPLLRTHERAGATLSLKNHLGSVCEPDLFHYDFYNTSPAQNSLAVLNSHPYIKDKTILIIDDAIYGLKSGGPMGNPDGSAGIKPYPNSIFMSEDPVAIDSVMIDYLQSIGAQIVCSSKYLPCGNPRTYLSVSSQANLGNYAASCVSGTNCSFSYPNIELIKCTETCSSALTPTPSPTPVHCTPLGDLNCSGRVDIFDLTLLLGNFSSTSYMKGDLNNNGRVDIFDLTILLGNFGG